MSRPPTSSTLFPYTTLFRSDVYTWSAEAFDVPANYFTAGADLRDARQVTQANPFAKDYAWGKAELIEYKGPKGEDRKSTRLNSSHVAISYAVFCLKKKNKT